MLFAVAKFLVAIAGHTMLWVMVVNRSHAYGWPRKRVDYLTLVCGFMLLVGTWLVAVGCFGGGAKLVPPSIATAVCLPAVAYTWLSVAAGLVGIAHAAWRSLLPERRGGERSRRESPIDLDRATVEELLAPGMPRILGRLPGNQVVSPRLVEIELAVPELPERFEGLTITHLSDLHMSGRIERKYFDLIVDRTNSLQADIVAITGDIVERPNCLDWIDESLARLEAQQAKLFVLGNHDPKAGPEQIRERLVNAGFVDLGGRVEELELNGGKCLAAGNEMPWFPPAPDLTMYPTRGQTPDMLRLALIHTPDHFAWTQRHAFHVALAGHNHGGQIRFPLLGALVAPSKYGTRYDAGVFRHRGTVMHLSQGTSCLTPVRWMCPPVLSLLTLRRAD